MTGSPTWRRLLLADSAWLGIAALGAFAAGSLGDQLFRRQPLGLRYQTAVQRASTAPAPEVTRQALINLVSLEEVMGLLARPDVITLDARPFVFYELGHLPGARSLSREQFKADFRSLESLLRSPGRTLLVYCSDSGCEDSALVARALQERGLQSLLIFPGGYAEWEAAGQPVETAL